MKNSTKIALAGVALYIAYYTLSAVVGAVLGVRAFSFLFVYFAGWFGRDLWRWLEKGRELANRLEKLENEDRGPNV